MDIVTRVVVLSVGGALGVNARYWLAVAIDRAVGTRFPWATLTINVSGAMVLGFLATLMMDRLGPTHPLRLAALVGFLGGYTTFSTFALEGYSLFASGRIGRSLAYMAGSVAAGFVGVAIGIAIGRLIVGPPPQRAGTEAGTTASVDGAELAELA